MNVRPRLFPLPTHATTEFRLARTFGRRLLDPGAADAAHGGAVAAGGQALVATGVAGTASVQETSRADHAAAAGTGAIPEGDADCATWLTPVAQCATSDGRALDLEGYLDLVDATGRLLRGDKTGNIPARLAPILARLDLDRERWLACMQGFRQFVGSAVGALVSRVTEATRRAAHWVQNRCALFIPKPSAAREPIGSASRLAEPIE